MPRTTARHAFEFAIHGWALRLRDGDGFLALLDDTGALVRVIEADHTSFGNRCVSHPVKDAVVAGEPRWIFYDPFDAPEYAWLSWEGVSKDMWNRLLADPFDPGVDVPTSWGVMF